MTTQIERSNHNLAIWSAVEKTDPAHTKTFSRAGGFSGTAVNQAYQARRATELFGPIGIGWGFDELEHEIVDGAAGDKVWFAKVRLWYQHDGRRGEVTQWGATTFVGRNKNGAFTDEEAAKKSITDAVGKCLSLLGFSADVYLGQFDDQKYVNDRRREEATKKGTGNRAQGTEKRPPVLSPLANGNGHPPAPNPQAPAPDPDPDLAAFRDAIAAATLESEAQRAERLLRSQRALAGRPISDVESALITSCTEAACQRIRSSQGSGQPSRMQRALHEKGSEAPAANGKRESGARRQASENGRVSGVDIQKAANGRLPGPVAGEHLMRPRGSGTAHPHPSPTLSEKAPSPQLAPDIAAFREFCAQALAVTDVKRGEHMLRSRRLRDGIGIGDAESQLVASWADAACRRIRAARKGGAA